MNTHLKGVVAGLLCAPVAASAATIEYTGETVDENGTGYGNILRMLVVQPSGNATTATGGALWNGTAAVLSGDAQQQSEVHSVAELTAAGIHAGSMALIFNVNEPGAEPSVVLQDFELVFQDAAGNELFTAVFDAPEGGLELTQVGNGQGAAGYVFLVKDFSASELAFFENPDHRVGQRTLQPLLNVAGGAENFYLQAVPEPGTAVLLGALAPMALRRRRR